MTEQQRGQDLASLAQRYAGRELRDPTGERIGRAEEIFVDESGRPEYVSVVDGDASAAGLALIPCEKVRLDEERGVMEVSESRDRIFGGPAFEDGAFSRDYEERLRGYYGLDRVNRRRGSQPEGVEAGLPADSPSGLKPLAVFALVLVAVAVLWAAYRRRG